MSNPDDATRAARIAELTRRFEAKGAANPAFLAAREVDHNAPVLARFLFMRSLWDEVVLPSRYGPQAGEFDGPVSRMFARGVSQEDLGRFAARVAFDAVSGVLQRLDDGYADFEDPYPGWQLTETAPPDGEPTGRSIDSLLEGFMIVEPSAEDLLIGFEKPEERAEQPEESG